MKHKCSILINPHSSPHLSQIYSGFTMLSQKGKIDLKLNTVQKGFYEKFVDKSKQHLKNANYQYLMANIDDKKIFYDMHDSYKISSRVLNEVDIYFKRSYLKNHYKSNKVIPFGLNMRVNNPKVDLKRFYIEFNQRNFEGCLGALKLDKFMVKQAEGVPRTTDIKHRGKITNSNIFFFTLLYDPNDNPERTKQKRKEIEELNSSRIELAKVIKSNFRDRATCGIMKNDYSRKIVPKELIMDKVTFTEYLDLINQHSICISSTGLHGSIPWKFANYIAGGKCIVTEKLLYLEFETPEGCIQNISKLIQNEKIRFKMSKNNLNYYNTSLKPDKIIKSSIDFVTD